MKVNATLDVEGLATFVTIPVGPASNPTTDNQLTRKAYVDSLITSTASIDPGHKHSKLWASDGDPEAITVDAAGLVGIGGSPTTDKLELFGNCTINSSAPMLTIINNSATQYTSPIILIYNSQTGYAATRYQIFSDKRGAGATGYCNFNIRKTDSSTHDLDFISFDASTNHLTLCGGWGQNETHGNVAIGSIATPSAKLHVYYAGGTTPTGPTGTWAAKIEMLTDLTGYNGLLVTNRWGTDTSKIFEVGSYWSGTAEVYTPALTVLGNRNVGIGTTAPQARLQVSQDILISYETGNSTDGWLYFGLGDPAYNVAKGGIVSAVIAANESYWEPSYIGIAIDSSNDGSLVTTADVRLSVWRSGNVGIGTGVTTAPVAKLQVAGGVIAANGTPPNGGYGFAESGNDTGIWSDADGVIKFSINNNANTHTMYSDGDVTLSDKLGLNTIDPAIALAISSGGGGNYGLNLDTNGGGLGHGWSMTLVTEGNAQMHICADGYIFPSPAKFWAKISVPGGTPGADVSYNYSSVSDDGVGQYTVYIANDFTSANYVIHLSSLDSNVAVLRIISQAAGSFQVETRNGAGTLDDPTSFFVSAI